MQDFSHQQYCLLFLAQLGLRGIGPTHGKKNETMQIGISHHAVMSDRWDKIFNQPGQPRNTVRPISCTVVYGYTYVNVT